MLHPHYRYPARALQGLKALVVLAMVCGAAARADSHSGSMTNAPATLPTYAGAAAQDVSVMTMPASVTFDSASGQLTIETLNQQWHTVLENSPLLGERVRALSSEHPLPEFFTGVVTGQENTSWVRLAKPYTSSGEPLDESVGVTGHLFVNDQLYELRYDTLSKQHLVALVSHEMLNLSSLSSADNPLLNGLSTSATRRNQDNPADEAPLAIRIGIAIDSRYDEHYNGRGLAHALGVINAVDGLYQDQLGLAVVVDGFRIYQPDEDPIRQFRGSVEQVLEYYRDYRQNDDALPVDLALVHLFSGHGDPDKVIGLGWINSLCRDDGYDVSLSTPFPFDSLLAAHEIAHNLGAIHDDDPQCLNDPSITGSEIMWSELSGRTRSTFSSCSVNHMRQALNTSCVADNIDVSVSLTSVPDSDSRQQRLQISVLNADHTRAGSQIISQTYFPPGTLLSAASAGCSIEDSLLTCQHGDVQALTQSHRTVTASFDTSDNPLVTSELRFEQFVDTQQLDNRAALRVDLHNATVSAALLKPVQDDDPTQSDTNSYEGSGGGSSGIGGLGPLGTLGLAWITGCLIQQRRKLRSAHIETGSSSRRA